MPEGPTGTGYQSMSVYELAPLISPVLHCHLLLLGYVIISGINNKKKTYSTHYNHVTNHVTYQVIKHNKCCFNFEPSVVKTVKIETKQESCVL